MGIGRHMYAYTHSHAHICPEPQAHSHMHVDMYMHVHEQTQAHTQTCALWLHFAASQGVFQLTLGKLERTVGVWGTPRLSPSRFHLWLFVVQPTKGRISTFREQLTCSLFNIFRTLAGKADLATGHTWQETQFPFKAELQGSPRTTRCRCRWQPVFEKITCL